MPLISREVSVITTQELEDRFPDLTPKEREDAWTKDHPTTLLMQIGGKLKSGQPHDGRAPDYDEPGAMETFALARGVPEEALILDRAGVNTDASVRRARDEFGVKRVVLVTQEYHLYRALYLAESYGLEAHGVSATLRTYGPKQIIWSAREVLARDKDFARMVFR